MATAKSLGILDDVDAEVEFPPHVDRIESCAEIIRSSGDDSYIRSYSTVMNEWRYDCSPKPVYRSVMMAWDNSARRRDGWHSFADFTQRDYVLWIEKNLGVPVTFFSTGPGREDVIRRGKRAR